MQKISLNGAWTMTGEFGACDCTVPGSVFDTLLKHDLMPNPYYRDNSLIAFETMKKDYAVNREFSLTPEQLSEDVILLCCDGLDTDCDIYVNGQFVAHTENMYRRWEFDIKALAKEVNNIEVKLNSPIKLIDRRNAAVGATWGGNYCTAGYGNVRKAHSMYGWDWVARMPDAGIYRDIYVRAYSFGRIVDCHVRQRHEDGEVYITPNMEIWGEGEVKVTLVHPNSTRQEIKADCENKVENPQLWWPNGYGEQPLYTVEIELLRNSEVIDTKSFRIGLRTVTIKQEYDWNGQSFAHCVNGVTIFGMGTNFVPMDSVTARITKERTYKLLQDCKDANHNAIRVWGGGYYPDDYFFDACDEFGILVWQDFMFCVSNYNLRDGFKENIAAEFVDVVKRIRNHASLALWCGSNELSQQVNWGTVRDFNYSGPYNDYRTFTFEMIPETLKKYDPDTFYWPSSPYGVKGDINPNEGATGDTHHWTDNKYWKKRFRYLSEFGMNSLPDYSTIIKFTAPEDRYLASEMLERHQRGGTPGSMALALCEYFPLPESFEEQCYLSQVSAGMTIARSIPYFRADRGYCSGTLYWQLNDMWPCPSPSAIDYYDCKKAMWYFIKRSFSPVLVYANVKGDFTDSNLIWRQTFANDYSVAFTLCNDTLNTFKGQIKYKVCESNGTVFFEGSEALEAEGCNVTSFEVKLPDNVKMFEHYVHFEAVDNNGKVVYAGNTLLTLPKYYKFQNPEFKLDINDDYIDVTANSFAFGVQLYTEDGVLECDDNFFSMEKGTRRVKILKRGEGEIKIRTVNTVIYKK